MGLFGVDMGLDGDGNLAALPGGGVAVVEEEACLVQDLWIRVNTPRRGLWGHPTFGCDIFAWIQGDDTPEARAGAEQELESALEEDPRVESARATASSVGDGLVSMRVEVKPIGAAHPLNLVVGGGIEGVTLEVARA